jgi:aldose 1-epimerase
MVAAAAGAFGATAASAAPARPAAGNCGPSVSSQYFGSTYDSYAKKDLPVYRYTLTNCNGVSAKVLSFGGIIQQVSVPGRNGQEADVVLGFKTLQDYVTYDSPPVTANGGPYFGETIGRYGNRIAKGVFSLQQPSGKKTYTVPVNNGVNSLHGGLVGFGNHVWASKAVHGKGTAGVQLTLVSPNGDQSFPAGSPGCPTGCTGYPATLKVVVTDTLNNAGQLAIHYKTADVSKNLNSVINLTNHSYFNLAGEASPAGSAYRQKIQINANKYTPTDTTQIPLGYNVSVKGTPFDFTKPYALGSRIDDVSAPHDLPVQLITKIT